MVSPGVAAAHAGSGAASAGGSGLGRRLLALGLLAVLAALAFPFAPVAQPVVTYSWPTTPGDPTAAAVPLMPYQPAMLAASATCAAARDARGGALLATVPPSPDPTARPLAGLRITGDGGSLRVSTAGVELGEVALPPSDCLVTLVSTAERTAVRVDDAEVLARSGDVRPAVAGVFTDAPDARGLSLELTTDTRFQTSITPLKAGIGLVCLLALLGALAGMGTADRSSARRVRALPRDWWRPRPVDAAVGALLATWWIVGAITVDDGYIAGIVRSRDTNGFIGNVYRWLNAPEAPFSWFYHLYHLWSSVSASTLWMRLPATLLGLLCWWLLSRAVVPRLGRFAARRSAPWLAALAFATWWIPFNLGLRPEPWVAVGGLAVFLAVERAIATRRVRPLALALLIAGCTTAVTPAGLLAFAPIVAASAPLLRLLRSRRDLGVLPLLAVLVAAPAAAVLLMVFDQSLAGVLEATRVRALIGGGLPWYQEYERYRLLLEPANFQGAIGRRAAVLLTLLAAVAVARTLSGRPRAGIAAGPARRLLAGLALALVPLTFSPTKWTQHFGDLAGMGAAVLLLGLVASGGASLRARMPARAGAAALACTGVVGALVLAGYNAWPYASNWFAPTWSTVVPTVAGRPLATLALAATAAVVLPLLAWSVWRRSAGGREPHARWLPAPSPIVALLLSAVLALQVLSLARVAVEHRDSYTLASDALATLTGDPCGLHRKLLVETDPAAGVLPATGAGTGTTLARTVDAGGTVLGGIEVAGSGTTPWFALSPRQRGGGLPVVVTMEGGVRPGDVLALEFGDGDGVVARVALAGGGAGPTERRIVAPGGADTVRIVVDAPQPDRTPAAISLPRAPQLTPMLEVLPPGTEAILDWPVAFLFPCLRMQPLPFGTASLARWRLGPPLSDGAAGITYAPAFGGPFAAPRLLVTERRMPTYLVGDLTRDAAQLYRWEPVAPLVRPRPAMTSTPVPGWASLGSARVPGLDPVG